MKELREQELADWTNEALSQLLPESKDPIQLEIVSGDASFRHYYRARVGQASFIAVDAPPENENSETFVKISKLFREVGVNVPKVYSVDYERGFMLLEDFGDELYLAHLLKMQKKNAFEDADQLYQKAITSLVELQKNVDSDRLDPYDRKKLHDEMALFETWFCEAFLELQLSQHDRELIAKTFTFLEDAALSQAEVAVHRDYHSRNLMLLDAKIFGEECGPGIVDFQDAVSGPYSYDVVSLLRDCYIRWDQKQLRKWGLDYLREATRQGVFDKVSAAQFSRDLDLMGLQRQLKVMGIFARLCIRDKKPQYLADIPLVIEYFLEVSYQYPELAQFARWFTETVLPPAKSKLNLES